MWRLFLDPRRKANGNLTWTFFVDGWKHQLMRAGVGKTTKREESWIDFELCIFSLLTNWKIWLILTKRNWNKPCFDKNVCDSFSECGYLPTISPKQFSKKNKYTLEKVWKFKWAGFNIFISSFAAYQYTTAKYHKASICDQLL